MTTTSLALIRHHDDVVQSVRLSSWTMTVDVRCFVWMMMLMMKHLTDGIAAAATGTAEDHCLVTGLHVDEHLSALTSRWQRSDA